MSSTRIVIISSLVKVISHSYSHRATQHVYLMNRTLVGWPQEVPGTMNLFVFMSYAYSRLLVKWSLVGPTT